MGWKMQFESKTVLVGDDRHGGGQSRVIIHGSDRGSLEGMLASAADSGASSLLFVGKGAFASKEIGLQTCDVIRKSQLPMLWNARLWSEPDSEVLKAMRFAGCRRLELHMDDATLEMVLPQVLALGFAVCVRHPDGSPYALEQIEYSLEEREVLAVQHPELHMVQFELAVAYFKAERLSDVMQPLGRAMTLGFPATPLCLNLLACLGAAKHYPEMAAGLLYQAGHWSTHPVVARNASRLEKWLANNGDIKGERLMLEPDVGVESSM